MPDADAPSILLIEDDEGLRGAYGVVLAALGLRVEVARTGEEALRLLQESPPDAIVADLGLPGLGGPALLRRLRARAPEPVLVVLTGHDSETLQRSCREAGAGAFLVKPVTGRELHAALAEQLERASPGNRNAR